MQFSTLIVFSAAIIMASASRIPAALNPRAQSCSVYTDCDRCQSGSWRCCFAGCAGMPPSGGQKCTCIQDGHDLGASCGCT
ncbi:hypothetical protein QBC43DRAFT_310088 [Cladorrhinum sp. PSN259]|nr:hypothetical protein QBC43DRAFT_310088 [Cladorrhinum sp. PSN259]